MQYKSIYVVCINCTPQMSKNKKKKLKIGLINYLARRFNFAYVPDELNEKDYFVFFLF